ncbi:hypothetical protein [Hyphococcus sp.]|uniref:hypothetical protein n=1 Tax=Hyphococcus sp. TaxID=2038636 RepID=UPI0037522380
MTAALANSYGAINHGYHIWVWLAAIFATAPTNLSQLASRRDKLGLLATITGAQLFVLLTYSLAGLHKFKGGIAAMLQGDAGNFSLTGPAAQIADRILQTETEPFAAAFVISHTGLFAPLFWGLIFCQLLALVVVFFPRLHRSFGLVLIGFHFGTWALMEISFPLHVIWLLIFFVMSPFRPLDNSDSPLAILRDFFRWGRNIFAAPRLGIGQKQAIRRPAA